ncbi:MAG TPA: hypothetical protein PLK85_04360 [Alphaproteobacteria bacterium]|nr:hypothetical protein [Alphaproteobacteria bacterium]
MKIVNLYQHIDIKRIFIILLIFFCVITPVNAQAQTPTPPSAGTQIVTNLLNGSTTLNQAATTFSQQANIPLASAQQILQNVQNLPQTAQTAAGNLVNSVIQQTLPPNVAQTLSTLNTLGQLANAGSIGAVFQNPQLVSQLQSLVPAQLQQTISTVTGLVSTAQALQNINPQTLLNAVTANLSQNLLTSFASTFSGNQLVQSVLTGGLNINQAATSLAQQANIPIASAQQILSNIQNLPAAAQAAAGNLVTSVIQQNLPPSIAQALSTVQQLGQLTSPQAIASLFQNQNILSALNGMNPQQALQAIGTITNLVSNIQNLPAAALAAAQTAISNAIASTLQSVAPGLVSALGGQAAVAGLIGSLLGGAPGAPSTGGSSCTPNCAPACQNCAPFIQRNHQIIRAHVTAEFEQYRNWFVNNFFMDKIAPALGLMTSELTATGIQKIQIIGTFFDAKHQLETQRLFQTLTAQAHKDYHPSEEICKIGTGTRSLVTSERRSDLAQAALANRMMDRQLLSGDALSLEGEKSDRESRLALFINKYCNMDDHAGGLQQLCQNGSANPNQVNMDIDYTNSIENKLTLELDFTQGGSAPPATDDEENVFMLSSYLFANEVLPSISGDLMTYQNASSSGTNPVKDNANYYQEIRAIAAKRSVAQNSFAAITALKAEGDSEAAPFLKAILAETGINPTDINDRLGTNPSYFAQMEVLTKILYQDPNFYTNLIDKPVNNERMAAILEGIGNMQDRDIYDSIERSNAILATLISVMSQKEHQRIYNDLRNVK